MAFKRDDDEIAEGGLALCAALRSLVPASGETCAQIDKAEKHFQTVITRGKKKPVAPEKPAAEKKG
jgi:hypothetical protein